MNTKIFSCKPIQNHAINKKYSKLQPQITTDIIFYTARQWSIIKGFGYKVLFCTTKNGDMKLTSKPILWKL